MSEHRVDALDQAIFDDQAAAAAEDLRDIHHTFIVLEPGDATRCLISIVVSFDGRYWLATTFGPLYEFNPQGGYDWGYVLEHWLPYYSTRSNAQEWTARVLARFLNALADKMKEG